MVLAEKQFSIRLIKWTSWFVSVGEINDECTNRIFVFTLNWRRFEDLVKLIHPFKSADSKSNILCLSTSLIPRDCHRHEKQNETSLRLKHQEDVLGEQQHQIDFGHKDQNIGWFWRERVWKWKNWARKTHSGS